ncbi:hypothetical protein PMZ80_003642 [Knufia obscura]|uniref:AB hydrolase-1 domain-containing protein n=2 Tax=Knufia TaxID=430999 RepID=A0AAN8ICE3_9EURO|nr:hypothetical protein PMZ80_003642 [Knufia obscura]KAK5958445.1 hypothetical protein OHC33_000288 [Knufia fluminis]
MAQLFEEVKNNTAIILVPGSFTPPEFYSAVSRQLITNGFDNVSQCQLLSACPKHDQKRPTAKLEDDALYIREVIWAYLTQGKDVVLVMNSYGGLPGTEAIKDLPSRSSLAAEMVTDVRKGAVVGMIYLSSFLPYPGDSLRSMMGDNLFEPLKSGAPGQYMELPGESGPGIFSDWTAEGKEEEVKYWFERMITHSSDSFDGKVTHDLWKEGAFDGKAMYIVGENDMVVPPALADKMIEKVWTEAGQKKLMVKRVEGGGHCMHVTRPNVVVGAIEDLLSDLVEAS